jgi:uncharacterized protein
MKFYGRQIELAVIRKWFQVFLNGSVFTALIGRRRIGKTRLWLEASSGRSDCLYLFCLPGESRRTFEQVEDRLFEIGFSSVPEDLSQFFKAVSRILATGQPLVLFFDEVQNLFLERKHDLALFQRYIDEFKQKQYPCLLVFCGSARTLLEEILFDERSPLYGRLDQRINLSALSFSVIQQLFLDHRIESAEPQLRLFTICGTNIRFYEILLQFGLLQRPIEEILDKGWLEYAGLFSDELNKMLLPEFKKMSGVYTGILTALAKGVEDATEIASQAGVTTSSLGNYLPHLMDTLDLVFKETPVTELAHSKISRYRIKDPFILFWYRYIEKNRALLELGQQHKVRRAIVADLPNLEGRILEAVFRERVLENPPMPFDIAGPVFRHREQIEIDFLLADESTNRIHAYEFKRGRVDRKAIQRKLLSNVSRLNFKSIRLRHPEITTAVMTLEDL